MTGVQTCALPILEARGIQRKARSELQQGTDQITDLEQSVRRDTLLQNFLQLRLQLAQAAQNPDSAPDTELANQLQQRQTQLLHEWQRCFAVRQPRSLTPEQLARATYTGLALDRHVREKAASDWLQTHQNNPAVRDDQRQKQLFINTAISVDGPWEILEDLIFERFSAPAGTPQDSFFATVDQALALQNSAEYLNLLKPASGNLAERLIAMDSLTQLAETLYLSVLCRPPDAEETQMVVSLLTQHPHRGLQWFCCCQQPWQPVLFGQTVLEFLVVTVDAQPTVCPRHSTVHKWPCVVLSILHFLW